MGGASSSLRSMVSLRTKSTLLVSSAPDNNNAVNLNSPRLSSRQTSTVESRTTENSRDETRVLTGLSCPRPSDTQGSPDLGGRPADDKNIASENNVSSPSTSQLKPADDNEPKDLMISYSHADRIMMLEIRGKKTSKWIFLINFKGTGFFYSGFKCFFDGFMFGCRLLMTILNGRNEVLDDVFLIGYEGIQSLTGLYHGYRQRIVWLIEVQQLILII